MVGGGGRTGGFTEIFILYVSQLGYSLTRLFQLYVFLFSSVFVTCERGDCLVAACRKLCIA